MILAQLIDYLNDHLDVFVGMEAPEQTTGYVLIDQTGSTNKNHITTTTVTVQSYGASLYEAYTLNRTVQDVVFSFVEEPEVSSVKLETDYNFTNTATKQYRWQAVYQITHYLGGN